MWPSIRSWCKDRLPVNLVTGGGPPGVERLLEGLSLSAPGQVGRLRGLEVLELAGTAEARELLRELARGGQMHHERPLHQQHDDEHD